MHCLVQAEQESIQPTATSECVYIIPLVSKEFAKLEPCFMNSDKFGMRAHDFSFAGKVQGRTGFYSCATALKWVDIGIQQLCIPGS